MVSASRSRATVLIVDDDALARELLAQLLRTGGFDVIPVPTGEQALLVLCRHSREIDWLVSKVALPGLVCGRILTDEYQQHHSDRPVLLIAPCDSSDVRSSAKAVFIPPAAPMDVLEALKSLQRSEPAMVLQFPAASAA
jgi:CheY-like chemotaxis protein